MWAIQDTDRGDVSRKLPELPAMPEELAQIPVGMMASMIGKTIFAISARRVEVHSEWRVADSQSHRADDGRTEWNIVSRW